MNYNGIVVINAKNSNFNASFDGMPRRLPDGRIYATDKALKYCLREYFSKIDPVFVQREKEFRGKEGNLKQRYLTLKENYLKKCKVEELPKDEKEIIDNLLAFIDVRLFGVVFAVDSNISITGPCQIGYGINRYENSNIYVSSILSPYRNPNEKSQEAQQTTIGEESRGDDVYYVYDICLNMNSAEKQGIKITDSDITKLKEAMKYAVGEVVSTTMFGVETVSFIWLENKDDKIFNNLNSLVDIFEENNEVFIDYKKVMEHVKGEAQIRENYSSKVQNKGLE
ncbi:MAG: type I CRISPR-associated protein Cas7 [Candidatus Methanofastidiosum sp.]|nr:type I CRISPR-associated protein Cas7 [Methanofastidiosum sp.]